MKEILLIGNSSLINDFMSDIIMGFKGNCLHADSIFNGIEKLYANKVDVIVISSKTLKNEGTRFLDYVKDNFLIDKIIVSLDNGLNSLQHMPEGIQLVSSDKVKDFATQI